MITQVIKSKPISSLMGAVLVIGITVGLMLASALSRALSTVVPGFWPQLMVWLLAALIVFYLMRTRIIEYHYTISGSNFYIERTYGIRSKILLNVPLMDIVAFGNEDELRKARPNLGRSLNACLKGCTLPEKAIVYRQKGELFLVRLQPDEHMCANIWDTDKRTASQHDKWF